VLSVARCERQQPFGDADVTLLTALVPHVQRALQLHRRFIESHAAVDDLTAVLER
jgi:GAF domain-containing protein